MYQLQVGQLTLVDLGHVYWQNLPDTVVKLEICIANPGFDWLSDGDSGYVYVDMIMPRAATLKQWLEKVRHETKETDLRTTESGSAVQTI